MKDSRVNELFPRDHRAASGYACPMHILALNAAQNIRDIRYYADRITRTRASEYNDETLVHWAMKGAQNAREIIKCLAIVDHDSKRVRMLERSLKATLQSFHITCRKHGVDATKGGK